MANLTNKPNTIKSIGKKVADNGNASDYVYVPIGADSDNVDRPDGSTVEESLTDIEAEKVEIIPVEILPTSNIKEYPFIYALVKANETKGILYEYRDGEWIPYGNGSNEIWVGTKEECAKDFNNIENGTFVIIINKNEGTGETHTHDYVCFVTKEPTYSQTGTKTCTCFLCGESYTEEIPALVDSINPAGVIRIGTNEYATWKDVVEFNKYYKENQTVTIEATDNETGIKEIAYYLATAAINTSDIASINWTVYNDAFEIAPNNNYIIYARITDNADNVTYICSDGIVMDNIPPVFEGLEDGGTYPTGTVLNVEEGATLTVNNNVVDLVNNTYTFTEAMDNCILSLTDKAGNDSSSISIIIIDTSIAPFGEDSNWDYLLNENEETITLKHHNKFDEKNIIVYSNYIINNKTYKTVIANNDEDSESNYLFSNNYLIESVFFSKDIDYSKIKNASYMFNNCQYLKSVNLFNFNANNVDNMACMFNTCPSLKNVIFGNFNTSNVKDMSYMFSGNKSLESLDLTSFNTSNVRMTAGMFSGCEKLVSIDLTSFNTSNVNNMIDMFNGNKSLESLDLTSFNTSNVRMTAGMFSGCEKLVSIKVSRNNWNLSLVEEKYKFGMFDNCGTSEVTYI